MGFRCPLFCGSGVHGWGDNQMNMLIAHHFHEMMEFQKKKKKKKLKRKKEKKEGNKKNTHD